MAEVKAGDDAEEGGLLRVKHAKWNNVKRFFQRAERLPPHILEVLLDPFVGLSLVEGVADGERLGAVKDVLKEGDEGEAGAGGRRHRNKVQGHEPPRS